MTLTYNEYAAAVQAMWAEADGRLATTLEIVPKQLALREQLPPQERYLLLASDMMRGGSLGGFLAYEATVKAELECAELNKDIVSDETISMLKEISAIASKQTIEFQGTQICEQVFYLSALAGFVLQLALTNQIDDTKARQVLTPKQYQRMFQLLDSVIDVSYIYRPALGSSTRLS